MSRDVKIIDKDSGDILYEFSLEEVEKAYAKAEELEGYGLNIELKSPSIPETLIKSLGASGEDVNALNEMLEEEIASHIEEEVGCAVCPTPKKH